MVLGIAIGVVLFIIYEKQRHSVPINGEMEGFSKNISNVPETNPYWGKLLQDYHLQTNENKGSKDCLHKYVDIAHFKKGIKIHDNANASALQFCTNKNYPGQQVCSQSDTCGSCISYKNEFDTINKNTKDKCEQLTDSIGAQKTVFNNLKQPIQNTVLALELQINRRRGLMNKVKKTIEDTKELEASIKTLQQEKVLYNIAKYYCTAQENSRFYKNIKARKKQPGKNYMDLNNVNNDSLESPPGNNPYKCWSNHRVQTLHWVPNTEQCKEHKKFKGKSPDWGKNAVMFGDSTIKTSEQSYGQEATPNGAAISSKEMKDMSCNNFHPNSRSYTDGNKIYVLKEGDVASYEKLEGDCEGNDLKEIKGIEDIEKCKKICGNNEYCKGFSHSKNDKICILKYDTCSNLNPLKTGTKYDFYKLKF